MLTDLPENGSSFRKFAEVLVALKKLIPRSGVETPNDQLRNDVERLALSAPHLLADIGFERDPKMCSSDKVVWRRGTLRVLIFSKTRAVAFV